MPSNRSEMLKEAVRGDYLSRLFGMGSFASEQDKSLRAFLERKGAQAYSNWDELSTAWLDDPWHDYRGRAGQRKWDLFPVSKSDGKTVKNLGNSWDQFGAYHIPSVYTEGPLRKGGDPRIIRDTARDVRDRWSEIRLDRHIDRLKQRFWKAVPKGDVKGFAEYLERQKLPWEEGAIDFGGKHGHLTRDRALKYLRRRKLVRGAGKWGGIAALLGLGGYGASKLVGGDDAPAPAPQPSGLTLGPSKDVRYGPGLAAALGIGGALGLGGYGLYSLLNSEKEDGETEKEAAVKPGKMKRLLQWLWGEGYLGHAGPLRRFKPSPIPGPESKWIEFGKGLRKGWDNGSYLLPSPTGVGELIGNTGAGLMSSKGQGIGAALGVLGKGAVIPAGAGAAGLSLYGIAKELQKPGPPPLTRTWHALSEEPGVEELLQKLNA